MQRWRKFAWWFVLILVIALAVTLVPACSPAPLRAYTQPTGMQGGIIATPTLVIVAQHKPIPYDTLKGPNQTKRVVLTYDDCPRTIRAFKAMVDYASAHDRALVLFPTGDCIKSYKRHGFNLVTYARSRGIWVANHSISHPLLTTLSLSSIVTEISGTAVSNYGRPPYGGVNKTVRQAYKKVSSYSRHGMRIWTWTVDTKDWKALKKGSSARPSGAVVARRAIQAVRAGGTILMHMQWHGFTPKTLHAIEKGLAAKGLKLCKAWHGVDHAGPIEATGRVMPRSIC